MNPAPIALFVYNRPRHTALAIAALRQNTLAAQSMLYVFSDGPKFDKDVVLVEEVRAMAHSLDGFASVIVVERENNLGLSTSIISGVTEVVGRHGKVVVLEDDLITSPYFLAYMNDALDFYQDDDRVVNIHGYMYPVVGTLPETFFLKDTGSWGWATWQRGWDIFEPDGALLMKELQTRKLIRKFDMDSAYPFYRILRDQVAGSNDSWAIRWQASAFLDNRLTLYPGRSLVNNIGNDSSGVHCGSTVLFENMPASEPVPIFSVPVEENIEALELLKTFFRASGPSLFVRFCMMMRRKLSVFCG